MLKPSVHRFKPGIPLPSVLEGNSQGLCLESTLTELTQYDFQVEGDYSGIDVAQIFERYPQVPGVVLLEQGQMLGMISRQRLLECLIRAQGMGLLLIKPLAQLHSYVRANSLLLPESTPIVVAAQLALRRSLNQQSEPIVVQTADQSYRLIDVHELNIAHWQIRGIETQVRYERAQAQMIQTERMASLGRLVDGVAHEILDPVGFIWGNLVHISTYTDQVMELLAAYEDHFPEVPPAIANLQTEIELDYVRQDIPQTIASIKSGAERLKHLVTSLQNFCHIDDVYPKPADLHECLDSILLLLKSRLSSEITVVRHYGHLPPVSCYAGQLSQVFMNILTNAADALLNQAIRQEVNREFSNLHPSRLLPTATVKPQITIMTQVRSLPAYVETDHPAARWISIRIADNGPGIPAEKCRDILESFSVEKRAAKETSLSVSYQIVTAKHGGKLFLRSPANPVAIATEPTTAVNGSTGNSSMGNGSTGGGTEFEILLPLV